MIKWTISKLLGGLMLFLVVGISHDVGMSRAGGKDVIVPRVCRFIYKHVKDFLEEPNDKPAPVPADRKQK